jgi:hypothetical protein
MSDSWTFADSIPLERRTRLTADAKLGDVLARIMAGVRHAKPRWHPASYAPLTGAVRFEVYIESPDDEAMDYFHNGSGGYRAQYAMSELRGDEANAQAVNAVTHLVREAMTTIPSAGDIDVEAVLSGPGVKLWIDQDVPCIRQALAGEWVEPELLVARWLRAAKQHEFVLVRGKQRFKANAGILAPQPRRLAFRSGWWKDGSVVSDPDKIERSHHLHLYGFA